MMAERPTGSHPYPLTSQQSAPGILPSQQQAQQMQQQLIPPAVKDINALNMNSQQHQERKAKLEDCLNHVTMQFRKLRVIHDKVVEITSQMEEPQEQQLIPIVGVDTEPVVPNTDVYRMTVEQHKEIVEQVRLKNQQLKEIIDQIRTIIWEINTMITMRKT
ncbi:hypothetical protein C0Q70_07491 [Pomacea canaliculata]|uniref:Mediator of RNA polymerase II transcription subunit 30 n=1 Tax=Pomacea canaliculata TaxID=400727 RepID=A0A2T7PF86_POMCA|nr:hypothetical protein C0Q70_07491 [Pomacea canaliculata]